MNEFTYGTTSGICESDAYFPVHTSNFRSQLLGLRGLSDMIENEKSNTLEQQP